MCCQSLQQPAREGPPSSLSCGGDGVGAVSSSYACEARMCTLSPTSSGRQGAEPHESRCHPHSFQQTLCQAERSDLSPTLSVPMNAMTKLVCRCRNRAWSGCHPLENLMLAALLRLSLHARTPHGKTVQSPGNWLSWLHVRQSAGVCQSTLVLSSTLPTVASQNSSLSEASARARPQSPTFASLCSK